MNVITFESISADKSFPFFDDYSQCSTFCKVYNDGSSYVAIPVLSKKENKRDYIRIRSDLDYAFDEIYFQALKDNVSKKKLSAYILSELKARYPEECGLSEFVDRKIVRVQRNLFVRKKRFRRKAFLNRWNYFVTFTYDDELHDEESFRKRLRKCLSNLHTRRGWLYMGVFERAPKSGRLHFHAIMYIPEGQMIGDISERRDYSTKQHKIQVTHVNTFFESVFGRNDFESLSDVELRRGTTMQYLLKYIEKTGERIVYSRGIPSDFYKEINDNDIICQMVDFVAKYILFDDVIDYEEDVKHVKNHSRRFFIQPLPS